MCPNCLRKGDMYQYLKIYINIRQYQDLNLFINFITMYFFNILEVCKKYEKNFSKFNTNSTKNVNCFTFIVFNRNLLELYILF